MMRLQSTFDTSVIFIVTISLPTTIPSAEHRAKLSQLEGKTGFGSSDYHGYGDDEQSGPVGSLRRPSIENAINAVQDGAADFAQKFAGQAQEDFESIKKLVSVGGSKLSDLLGDLQVLFFLLLCKCLANMFS